METQKRNIFAKRRDSIPVHSSAGGVKDFSGDNEFVDPWIAKLCQEVNSACDKFWTKTKDRRAANKRFNDARGFFTFSPKFQGK